jgi:8-oxo-dGTP diphosphatase
MPDKIKTGLKTALAEKRSHLSYFNIAISVDCVIFSFHEKKLKVLLIKSDLKEFKGLNSLIGDLVKPNEDLDAASYRILKQRTGLTDVYLNQVHTFGAVNRHPSGRVITTAYYSLVHINSEKLILSTNELHWHSVDEIDELAFDHKRILELCLSKLREEVMEHPIIFNLLPEKFSLKELQLVYEAVLGQVLDRRNFRKKVALKGWLIELNELAKDVKHRPGRLYKLKPSFKQKYAQHLL